MAHINTYARVKPARDSQDNYHCTKEVLQVRVPGPFRDVYGERSAVLGAKATTNHNFKFAHAFPEKASQAEVFKIVSQDVVAGFLDGYNGTIFAYGQTGSGKTYTMEGSARTYEERGLAPRALSMIYQALERRTDEDISIYISCMEIYQEVGYDLLNSTVRTNSVVTAFPKVAVVEGLNGSCLVRNLSTHLAANEQIAQNLLLQSEANRRVAETPMNKRSSRSHAIFTIQLASRRHNSDVIVRSKLHLVDLAGSERVAKSGTNGRSLTEAKFINLSLHYLEGVIIALQQDTNSLSRPKSPGPGMVNGWMNGSRPSSAASNREVHSGKYVPYRNSLLTMVLRDSLGGNCQTAMIATMSLETHNLSETLSTCRFAQRVACIKNIVRKNEEVDDKSMIRRLRKRVAELEMQISLLQSGNEETLKAGGPFNMVSVPGEVKDPTQGNQSSDMHCGNNVLDVRLTAEDKVECAKIMQGYLSGRLKDPILAGAHTVGKLRECLRILKVVILEHYSRKDQSQQLAGRTGSTPTSTMSSKPAGTEDTNTTPSGGGMEIPTVIVDRTGTNQAVLQQPGRRVASAPKMLMQPISVQSRTGAREWKFRVNQTSHTAATTAASRPWSADKPVILRTESRGTPPLRQNTPLKSAERQATPMKEPYKSPYERKKEDMIRKLDSKVTKAKAGMQEQQLSLVQAQNVIKLQQMRLIHAEIVAKVEETKKLVSEQQLKIQELSRYDVNSDIVQQEKLVEKQLFRRQVKMEKRLQMVANEIQSLKVKMDDVSRSAADARKTIESTPSTIKLEEKYPQFVSRSGKMNTTHVLDVLQSQDKRQEKMKATMEKQCVVTLSQQIQVKESATRQKLLAFKEKLRQAKLGNATAVTTGTHRVLPKVPWHLSAEESPDKSNTNLADETQRRRYDSYESADQQHSDAYPATTNVIRRQSSAGSGNSRAASAASRRDPTGSAHQNGYVSSGTVTKLISRFAQDESATTQTRDSVKQHDDPQTSLNSTGGVSFLQKYSQSRPGSAASSQLLEQWTQNPPSKVDSSKRWDDAYSSENSHPVNMDVDKAAFTATHHISSPRRSSSPIKEAGYEELPCVLSTRKDRPAVNGGHSDSRTRQRLNSRHDSVGSSNNPFMFATSRPEQRYSSNNAELNDCELTSHIGYDDKTFDTHNSFTRQTNGHGRMPVRSSTNGFAVDNHGDKDGRYYKTSEHEAPSSSTFDHASSSTGPATNSIHDQNGDEATKTATRPATFDSTLQSMLGADPVSKPVTISHEQYDRFARSTKPPVIRKSRAAIGRGRASQSPFASRTFRRDSFGTPASKQGYYASHSTWKPTIKETTVSEKVAAYLQGMSSYASAGGIVNTPPHSYDDASLMERRKPEVVEDESTDGPSGVWKRHLAAGKPKPDIDVDKFVPRIKALRDDEREVTYMNTAREQNERVARIRKSKLAAEVIQRSWRSYCAKKKR